VREIESEPPAEEAIFPMILPFCKFPTFREGYAAILEKEDAGGV
jgi:hypothetical protein